jgi:selenium metabolism protein YedF
MSSNIIDARGLPCPQPVILTRNAMRAADEVTTLVTSADQVANVRRLAEKAGWHVTVAEAEGGFALHLRRGAQPPTATPEPALASTAQGGSSPTIVVVPSDQMGRGEPELGGVLLRAFFHALTEMEEGLPQAIVLYNSGVRLAVQGSPIVDDLCALATRGIEVLVCGTCLSYYHLRDQVAVGVVSNMYTIAEMLLRAGNVVTL